MIRRPDEAYSELIRRHREAKLLASCGSILHWDESTYMPRNGSAFRGEQIGLLARLEHEMLTSPVIGELLAEVENASFTSVPAGDAEANIREIRRGYERAVKVPGKLVEEIARVSTTAQQVWRDARKASDFSQFSPHLHRLVQLLCEKADAIGHSGTRYDALLDEYEPGVSTADIQRVFSTLRRQLVPLIETIRESGRTPQREILHRDYPVDRQKFFGESAAAAIGFDLESGRLDVSTHPFCSGIGPGDCRLTTRYNPKFFNESFFGVLHEAGHGIYEQGLPAEPFGTPLGTYCSLGIHESQSRLWENQVGRGRPFWEHFFPRAQQTFPESLAKVSLDDWMFAINDVQPSFIRVEADEATYNLHIILRFELEQAILSDQLPVADIPGVWNEQFEKLLGLKVPSDAQGCLQDIHWSLGGMGYFPTYTLGNLYAAQFMEAARRDMPGLDDDFRQGRFGPLKQWLNGNIHYHGQRRRAGELCKRVTGNELDSTALINYLRGKYAPLYGF